MDFDSYQHIRLSLDDRGILTATITNPERMNAVTDGMADELDVLWREIDRDARIRVVVLQGEGDAFCAGLDLTRLAAGSDERTGGGNWSKAMPKRIRDRVFDIIDCETPTIAKVRGPAYGMGVNLALACDFVVAADDARFCDSHVANAVVAGDGGVAFFPLMVGFRRAKELLMLGEKLTGTEAAEIGLINKAVPGDELDAAVDALAVRLAEAAPLALAWTKLSINVLLKQLVLGAFETSIAYDMLSLRTEDVTEGTEAFFEKRKPEFKGK